MTTEQVVPLPLTTTRADQTVPTLTMAHIDHIAPHELARPWQRLRPVAVDARRQL
jgi:hypothetical protein